MLRNPETLRGFYQIFPRLFFPTSGADSPKWELTIAPLIKITPLKEGGTYREDKRELDATIHAIHISPSNFLLRSKTDKKLMGLFYHFTGQEKLHQMYGNSSRIF